MTRVIGIDLGTTNTLAAYADGRVPRIVPTERGHNLLPSVVSVVGGRVIVGHPARECSKCEKNADIEDEWGHIAAH